MLCLCCVPAKRQKHCTDSVFMQLSFEEHSSCASNDLQIFGMKMKKKTKIVQELTIQKYQVTNHLDCCCTKQWVIDDRLVIRFPIMQLSCQNCNHAVLIWLYDRLSEDEHCKGCNDVLPGAMWHSWVGAGVGVEGMLKTPQSNQSLEGLPQPHWALVYPRPRARSHPHMSFQRRPY